MKNQQRQKPKMMRVKMQQPDGSFQFKTVNTQDLKLNRVRRHQSLSRELELRAKALYVRVGYVLYPTIEPWIDGFCLDQDPDIEIALWEKIANVMNQLWLDEPKVLQRLDKNKLTRMVIAISSNVIDIPSQLKGVTDEQVAFVQQAYASEK